MPVAVPAVKPLRGEADVEAAVVVVVDERCGRGLAGQPEPGTDRTEAAGAVGEQMDPAAAGRQHVERARVVVVAERDLGGLASGADGCDAPPCVPAFDFHDSRPRRVATSSVGRVPPRLAQR